MGEEEFRKKVVNELKPILQDFKEKVEIGEKKKILKDVNVIKDMGKFKLNLGTAQQDIVIYLKQPIQIKANSGIKQMNQDVLIPLIICEVKIDADSHQLTTYSHIAGETKDKFPFVKYYLIMENSTKREETLWRHGKNFERIFNMRGREEKYQEIREEIKHQLSRILKDLGT